jgi:hypothetical protein
MATKTNKLDDSQKPILNKSDEKTLNEVIGHYQDWKEDNDTRRTRENGWNDITDAYYGKLPDDFPYNSQVVDPRLSTSLIEKNARLLNAKLKGRLVPREGGDAVKARINNAILDFQWDNATYGGSMLSKWSMMDMDARLYGSKFALVVWKVIKDNDGVVKFEGNEFIPKDIRDCGIDPNCQNVKDARWFQLREWVAIEDLEKANKNKEGIEIYPGLAKLKEAIENSSDRRDVEYESRLKQLKSLSDRMGDDDSFQIVEIVTEYRPDRWITFAPKHNVILRDIKNPYKHGKIPIVQLKYYPLGDDPLGESEVERVLPIWRAIQAVINAHLDGMNVRMFPPLKIMEGQARIETLIYGPGAPWIMNTPGAVTEMQFGPNALNEFQTDYSALVSAFNNAMGDLSQNNSTVAPTETEKTATEIKHIAKQQNIRDEKNQTDLSEAISDCMKMWLVNNQQFLLSNPDNQEYILRIVGKEEFSYFKELGMDNMEITPEAMAEVKSIIELSAQEGYEMTDVDMNNLIESAKSPIYPVIENPNVKDPSKYKYHPKLKVSEKGDFAELSVVPEDLNGTYDYVPDIKSMSVGADIEYTQGLMQMFQMMVNQNIIGMLAQDGVKINMQDLLISLFNQYGAKNAEQYFSPINQTNVGTDGLAPSSQIAPGQGVPPASPQGVQQQLAQSPGVQGQQIVPEGIQPPMG